MHILVFSFLLALSDSASAGVLGGLLQKRAPPPPTPEERRQEWVEAHPELSAEVSQAVLAGQVVPGMTRADLLAALGSVGGERAITPVTDADAEIWFTTPVESRVYHEGPGGSQESTEVIGEIRHFVRMKDGVVVNDGDTLRLNYVPCLGAPSEERTMSGKCLQRSPIQKR